MVTSAGLDPTFTRVQVKNPPAGTVPASNMAVARTCAAWTDPASRLKNEAIRRTRVFRMKLLLGVRPSIGGRVDVWDIADQALGTRQKYPPTRPAGLTQRKSANSATAKGASVGP